MKTDFELYDGKSYKDLLKDIVVNTEGKRCQIEIAIADLRDKIQTINDAIALAPIIQTYLETGIRNDEQLVKLAAVIQRLMSSQLEDAESAGFLTDAEKDQLISDIKNIKLNSPEIPPVETNEVIKEVKKSAKK